MQEEKILTDIEYHTYLILISYIDAEWSSGEAYQTCTEQVSQKHSA